MIGTTLGCAWCCCGSADAVMHELHVLLLSPGKHAGQAGLPTSCLAGCKAELLLCDMHSCAITSDTKQDHNRLAAVAVPAGKALAAVSCALPTCVH